MNIYIYIYIYIYTYIYSKSNHQFSEININFEQFYIQLHKLFTNKSMCNGEKMRPNIRKHLHGYI